MAAFLEGLLYCFLSLLLSGIVLVVDTLCPVPTWDFGTDPTIPIDSTVMATHKPPDESLPLLTYEQREVLLQNPDRGLRLETYITLGDPLQSYPGNAADPFQSARDHIAKYASDQPQIVQAYVYLSNYAKKPLDALAFQQLAEYFTLFRDNGIRILLRFAYSTESVPDASYFWVSRHLTQIGKWLRQNSELINDSLFCMQGGLIGYWGEGHSYQNFKEQFIGNAFAKLCRITPAHINVQIRYLTLAKKVPQRYQKRLGMHNDYVIGEMDHEWAYPMSKEDAVLYRKQFSKTLNDGEMPWGSATLYDDPLRGRLNNIDPTLALPEIACVNTSTFSLVHNYKETAPDHPANPLTLERWKTRPLPVQELAELGLPYNPYLYKNARGEAVTLSAFDYLQQHLGYQLLISNVQVDSRRSTLQFSLHNYGMAAPLGLNSLALVVGQGADAVQYQIADYDKTALQPGRSITICVKLPRGALASVIGLRMATLPGSDYTVRFANDTPYENGVQYFYNY